MDGSITATYTPEQWTLLKRGLHYLIEFGPEASLQPAALLLHDMSHGEQSQAAQKAAVPTK